MLSRLIGVNHQDMVLALLADPPAIPKCLKVTRRSQAATQMPDERAQIAISEIIVIGEKNRRKTRVPP